MIKQFEAGEFAETKRSNESLLFSDAVNEWMAEHVAELAVNTRESYAARMNRMLKEFGTRVISEINTRDVRLFLRSL